MSRRFGFALLWVLVTLLVAAGAASVAYHVGTMASVAASPGVGYAVHPYGGWWGWGWGFFPFGFLFPLFFIFLLVFLLRPRHWHHHDHDHDHRQQRFEEWHRRAHAEGEPGDQPPPRP